MDKELSGENIKQHAQLTALGEQLMFAQGFISAILGNFDDDSECQMAGQPLHEAMCGLLHIVERCREIQAAI